MGRIRAVLETAIGEKFAFGRRSICLLVFLAIVWPSSARAQIDPRAQTAFAQMDPWLRSLVYIRINCGPGAGIDVGTGVLVRATGEVLTAGHVGSSCPTVTTASMGRLQSLYTAPGQELTATFQRRVVDGRPSPTTAQIKGAVFQDLALWKITNMTGSDLVPATLATTFPMPGEQIEIAGFAGSPFWHTINGNFGANAGPGLTRFRAWLASVGASPQDVPYRLHYPGYTLSGVSGGPVFNAQGQLIGIHSTRTSLEIKDAILTTCPTDGRAVNCINVTVPGPNNSQVQRTIALDIGGLKNMLENYGWATSIFAIPPGWLP